MKLKYHCVNLVLMFNLISGCGSTQIVRLHEKPQSNLLQLPPHPFELVEVPEIPDLFYLDEAQKAAFIEYFNDPANQSVKPNKRLFNYLEKILDGFHFQGQTYSASQALTLQAGNCLSLAILTTSLAQLVDLEFSYQRVNSAPVYHRYHNVMTLSSHVRTHLFEPLPENETGVIVVRRPALIIDYFPQSGNVSGDKVAYDDFVAMYYQNLAGEALVKEDYPLAYSLLYKGWQLAPENPETLNTLGVLFNKMGRHQDAENVYAYTLKQDKGTVNILSNYHLLLVQQERFDEAKILEASLEKIKDDNPYRWFDIADRQYAKSNYSIALKYYKRALQEAPYLHEGHFGIAKVYYSLGMEKQAKESLTRALELTYVPQEQRLYQSKLKVLEASEALR